VGYRTLGYLSLFAAFLMGPSTAQNPPSAQAFCESIQALLQASHSDFRGIRRNVVRHSDGASEWVPSISVAGASDCTGQSDPTIASSIYCTGATSQSLDDLEPIYQNAVRQLRSCLDLSFVFEETRGGKATRLSTPIKEASFEVKAKDDGPDGPRVRITLSQWHSSRRSEYELDIWIDAKDKE
jgi:hypothetical protein